MRRFRKADPTEVAAQLIAILVVALLWTFLLTLSLGNFGGVGISFVSLYPAGLLIELVLTRLSGR